MITKSLYIFFLLTSFFCTKLSGQNGLWTWMTGSSGVNPSAVFGTIGVPSISNTPPGLYEAANWTDLNGNFWVFGGIDFASSGNYHNALWMFNPVTLEWTWIKGPSTPNQIGVYGTQGVPSPLNFPGGRGYGMVSWVDNSGDLWMYGGYGVDVNGFYGYLDELWRYNITNNEWTWMKGIGVADQLGIYGTLQVASPFSKPPGLGETVCGWVDNAGDLWLFGGYDALDVTSDAMWRYTIATNTWTWMSGQNSITSVNYGTQQVPSSTNTPGSRGCYAHWKDQQGNFWIFGGYKAYLAVATEFADMWMYNPNTLQWTWMAGSSIPNDSSTFTAQCTPGGHPQAVFENNVNWIDQCGRFWSMAGLTYSSSAGAFLTLSPLWCFDPASLQFTWVTNPNTPNATPIFGTQGIPSATNLPRAVAGPQSFVDNNGDFWLMGGTTTPNLSLNLAINSVWRYQIDSLCPSFPLTALISPAQPSGCAPYQQQFTSSVNGNISYFWDFGDSTTLADTSNIVSPVWTFYTPGTYTVTLIVSGSTACSSGNDTTTTIVNIYPQPSVNLGNDTTLCNSPVSILLDAGNPGATYQWSTGALTQTITASTAGTYSVTVTSGPNGLCSSQDSLVISLAVQPVISGDTAICTGQTLLLDPGITAQQFIWNTGDTTSTLLVSTAGFYSVQVINQPCTLSTSMNLTVNPLPVVALGSDTALCPDDVLSLDAQNAGANYIWNNGATSQSIVVSDAGTYAVTVTAQSCVSADTINVSITQNIEFNETVSLCGSPGGIVLDAGNPGASYLWNTGETTQTINIQQAGTYWVSINAAPCILGDTIEVTGSIGVTTFYIPNSFTPNNDGQNDRFTGIGENFTNFHLLIFNRWGELIFETFDQSGWDGMYQGEIAKGDVYVYKLTYSNICTGDQVAEKLGHVTLIR